MLAISMLAYGCRLHIQTEFVRRFYFVCMFFCFLNYIIIRCMLQWLKIVWQPYGWCISLLWFVLIIVPLTCGDIYGDDDDVKHFHKHYINSTLTFWRKLYTVWHRHAPYLLYRVWQAATWIYWQLHAENATSMFLVLYKLLFACAHRFLVCIQSERKIIFPILRLRTKNNKKKQQKKQANYLVVSKQYVNKSAEKKNIYEKNCSKIIIFRSIDLLWNYPNGKMQVLRRRRRRRTKQIGN